MGASLALLCILFLFVRADIFLAFRVLFRRGELQKWITGYQEQVARLIVIIAGALTRFHVKIDRGRGLELPRTFLLVSNHQSLADIPVLIYCFPGHSLRFVTKRELAYGIPMVSLFLRRGGHALVSRKGDYRQGRRELVRLAGLSPTGISPAVFPEGTRSRTGALRAFYSGAFRILLERAPLPVLSVAIDGGYPISRLTRVFVNLGKTHYRIKPLSLYPPPRGKRETLDLLAKVETEIRGQLRAWRDGGA